jgi:hypothetical protein
MAATLHVIFGPCGAGKTTYAHAFARREGAVPFILDDWGARLFGPDVTKPLELGWMLERAGRCATQLRSTATAVVAAGCLGGPRYGPDAPRGRKRISALHKARYEEGTASSGVHSWTSELRRGARGDTEHSTSFLEAVCMHSFRGTTHAAPPPMPHSFALVTPTRGDASVMDA